MINNGAVFQSIAGGYELIPTIPEARSVLGIAVLLGLVGWRERRFFQRHRPAAV